MITWKSLLKECIGGHDYEILYDEDTMLGIVCKNCNNTITMASYALQNDLKRWQSCVGPGWAPLVEQAFAFCVSRGIIITDVKEKYGSLRIYTDYYDDDVEEVLEKLDWVSMHVCEVCGHPGKMRPTGWIKTLCFRHYVQTLAIRKWYYLKHSIRRKK